MPTQTQSQDGKALTLGALFLVDHAPECPEEMSWHDFSKWAIAEHLKRHSYYYHQKGNREVANVAKMRSRILYICNNYADSQMPKPGHCDKEFKDKVDVLFGFGGTKLLKKSFLDGEGYDRDTFSESRLNKHLSEENQTTSAKIDGRPEGEDAEKVNGNDASKTDSHVIVGQERCASELAHPSRQSTVPSPSRHLSAPLQTSENSRTGLVLKLGTIHKEREKNGTNRDEQPPPSQNERRRLRSSGSVGPQTRSLGADNGTSYVSEEANDKYPGNSPGGPDESVSGAKRKNMQDHGLQKRQCQTNDATHQDDSKASETSQNAVTSREKQHSSQFAILNLDEQGWNMENLYTKIQGATDVILSTIGQIHNIASPLQPDPSGPLRDLYARCWGPRWRQMCARQIDQRFFKMPKVTTSVLSAFLCEKVLTQRARLEELVGNVVKIGGSLGEALLEEVDVSTREAAITKRARMIEAHKACSRLAQDSEVLQQQLKLEADSLAKDASTVMAPHLAALSYSAKLHLLSSDRPETDTLKIFESAFAKVIQRALHYRLQLLATGCEYTLTWPSPDDAWDSRTMQVDEGGSENDNDQSIVLFTVFPGLEIKPMSSNEMESLADAKAVVMVQQSEDES